MLKKWIEEIKSDWEKLMNLPDYLFAHYVMWRLKKRANKIHYKLRHRKNAQVIVTKLDGKIRFITKDMFKDMRQRGVFKLEKTMTDLKANSLYYTPNKYVKR